MQNTVSSIENILQNISEPTQYCKMDLDKNTKDCYNLDMATKNYIQQDGSAQKYPRRNITQKNYYEGEEPANDRYVYCDTCKEDYVDFCSNCGALVVLEDTPIRMGVEMRAKKTVPKGILEVQPSKIHGLGVIALRCIQKGVRLGPYQGQITRVDSTTGYAWKLKDGRLVLR
ncbi:PR domain-containing protein 11-like [Diabrotica virgifera virgifera]|uniref:Uncharacterized protein n=1 Tax=Diabrotica virgifera virgifera TaxID=50390 RepID=A0ABM5L0Z2_DIAVI|nr:PR domain-containing protein 11-like [Diabrotica virgifera virgifera]